MVPDAPYHYACDRLWWDHHYNEVKKGFKGESFTIQDELKERNPDAKYEITRVNSTFGEGLNKEMIHYGVHGGQNSGFQAANLAYILGAKTIILLGMDCYGGHFFGEHPNPLSNHSPYPKFMESWATITEVEVINCTRSTLLDCFPKKRLEDVL